MLFGRKEKNSGSYEDPATKYGRMLRSKKGRSRRVHDKPSLFARIFGSGHDSDFVYHED